MRNAAGGGGGGGSGRTVFAYRRFDELHCFRFFYFNDILIYFNYTARARTRPIYTCCC